MAYHRAILVALATLFTVGLTSIASACCGGSYAYTSCGGCGAPAPVEYGRPMYGWGTGCGGCGYYGYRTALVEPTYVARSPIYVVNQGPDFSGPGLMVPYRTWAPGYGPAFRYSYIHGYGHRYAYGYGYGWRTRHYWRHRYH